MPRSQTSYPAAEQNSILACQPDQATSYQAMVPHSSLKPIHPDYLHVMRMASAIWAVVILIAAALAWFQLIIPSGFIVLAIMILLAIWVWLVPMKRHARLAFDIGADRMRVTSGYLFFTDTVVPFGRIQHIDVDQGPLERGYDLATLVVHTAGSHGRTIKLLGLMHKDALELREHIRLHIQKASQ